MNRSILLSKSQTSERLVLFDLDDVITIPQKNYNISYKERKKLVKEMEQKYGENEAKKFWSIILQNRKIEYMDNKIPEIFSYLKKHKIPTMALTKCLPASMEQ
jgi:hypothetical protein